MIWMLIKYYYLKKSNTVIIIHINTLLGIMIMMLLDHYIDLFHKQLDISIYLKKIKQQWLIWLKINNFQKITKKIWEKVEKLMGTDFESKATYNDKYINTKIKTYKDSIIEIFTIKQGLKKCRNKKYHINVYQ